MIRHCRRLPGTLAWLVTWLALAGAAALVPRDAAAQPAWELNAVYGRGIHAYFAGQTPEALRLFSEVIESGSTDPRVYYFRAMARLRAGRRLEAEQDMQMGAMYEARDPGAAGSVGQALARIQGPNRQVLEKYRRQGRLDWSAEQRRLTQARYEQLRSRETEVLRQETPAALDALATPGATAAPAAATAPADEPPMAAPAEETPTPQPTLNEEPPAEPAADVDPFDATEAAAETPTPTEEGPTDEPALPADPTAEADPFDAEATPPAEEPSAEESAAPADADPFDAGEDPFDLEAAASSEEPIAEAAAPAESSDAEAESPAAAEPGVLGRILNRTIDSLTPDLPNPADVLGGLAPSPMGAEEGFSAASPEPSAFDLGPGDQPADAAPAAGAEEPATEQDGFGAPAEDDPFESDAAAPPADATEAAPAEDEPAAETSGDDPFADQPDPFADSTETEAMPEESAEESAADAEPAEETEADDESGDETEDADAAPADEQPTEEQPTDEQPTEDDPFGGF